MLFPRLGGRGLSGKSTSIVLREASSTSEPLHPRAGKGFLTKPHNWCPSLCPCACHPLPPVRRHVEAEGSGNLTQHVQTACDRAVFWFGTLRPQFFLTWDAEAMSCFLRLSVFVFPWRAGISSPEAWITRGWSCQSPKCFCAKAPFPETPSWLFKPSAVSGLWLQETLFLGASVFPPFVLLYLNISSCPWALSVSCYVKGEFQESQHK